MGKVFSSETKLKKKIELFAYEYVQDLNATQAYLRCNFTDNYATARTEGSKLLANPDTLTRVSELMKERKERLCISADHVLLRLFDIYEKCMQEKPVLSWSYEDKKMVETGEYSFDSKGALGAMQLIGKHIAMFIDKKEISFNGVQIVDDIPNDEPD